MSTYSGEAAEQVVRMTLEGTEVAARIAGSGARQLAVLLYAVLKDQKKTKGKIRLTSMLRSGKELKVFAVRDREVEKFCTEARKYGVLFTVLKDRDAGDGLTDIMVRAEDAGKINRIFERFGLSGVETGGVKAEVRDRIAERDGTPAPRLMTHQEKVEEFLDAILKPKEEERGPRTGNPTEGRTAGSRQSGPSSGTRSPTGRDGSGEPERRPSVKKQLEEIVREQKKAETPVPDRPAEHKAPKKKRRPKKEEMAV